METHLHTQPIHEHRVATPDRHRSEPELRALAAVIPMAILLGLAGTVDASCEDESLAAAGVSSSRPVDDEVGLPLPADAAALPPALRRFEFVPGPGTTLEVISKEMGLTKERVRQIQNKALRKIKGVLNDRYLAA